MKGKLYIHFSVDFPEAGFFSTEQCKVLETVLPSGPRLTEMDLDDCEETILENVNMEEELRRKQQQSAHEAYEEEEEEAGAPRVQCAQQ